MRSPHWFASSPSVRMSAATFTDNKEASEAANNEVKNLLTIKTQQSVETCPHRKTPVSQDIGTLFYDGEHTSPSLFCMENSRKKFLITDLVSLIR